MMSALLYLDAFLFRACLILIESLYASVDALKQAEVLSFFVVVGGSNQQSGVQIWPSCSLWCFTPVFYLFLCYPQTPLQMSIHAVPSVHGRDIGQEPPSEGITKGEVGEVVLYRWACAQDRKNNTPKHTKRHAKGYQKKNTLPQQRIRIR